MKIIIQPDGIAFNAANNRRLGNVISQPLSQFDSSKNIHLEIQLPNVHCNIGGLDPTTGQRASLFSPRNLEKFQPDIDRVEEVCQAIKAQLSRVSMLRIGGSAEPFWQDRIFSLLSDLEYDPETSPKIFVSTNATLLNEERTARWFGAVGTSEISVALHATCADTFFCLNQISEYDVAIQNIDHYCRTRNPDHHVAVLRNQINMVNIKEVEAMVQMTKDYFFHYLSLSPSQPPRKSLRKLCLTSENKPKYLDARRKAQDLADSIGVNVVFSDDWPE